MNIWGDKTVSFFDIWSIEHLVSGITLGSVIILLQARYKNRIIENDKLVYYISVAFLACLWEVVEHYLEAGLINDQVTYWFQGVEFWGNRILTDPLLVILGSYLNLRYNFLARYAQCFSITWLIVHIFVFPHCMYLQEILF
jgi:hypothetical protein